MRAIDAAVQAGIRDGVYPGAAVVVGRRDTILYRHGYGSYTPRDSRTPDPDWSLWDVASLTKVVATSTSVALLVQQGKISLDDPVSRYVPRLSGRGRDSITVRMLLDHTSGLPAWKRLSDPSGQRDVALALLFDTPPMRSVGQSPLYSDLNAMLASELVESVTGRSFDDFTTSEVFAPLGMAGTVWRPVAADKVRAVPTERRADGSYLVGTVHDANARALGGVSGHAGLFATATDLARFAQGWLRAIEVADSSWLSPTIAQSFLRRSASSGTRALGWDTPYVPTDNLPPLYGSCSHGGTTYGHTGFTGTLVWIDPKEDLFLVFMTNRTASTTARSLDKIRLVRAAVSDATRKFAGAAC